MNVIMQHLYYGVYVTENKKPEKESSPTVFVPVYRTANNEKNEMELEVRLFEVSTGWSSGWLGNVPDITEGLF